jgi:hypothetical protein
MQSLQSPGPSLRSSSSYSILVLCALELSKAGPHSRAAGDPGTALGRAQIALSLAQSFVS